MNATPDPRPARSRLLQPLASLAVSLAVAAWLLWPYRTADGRALIAAAFERASAWALVVAVVMAIGSWLTDAYAVSRTFGLFGWGIGFRETSLVRGATLVFDSVNPSLGQAALAVVMHRRGTPLGATLVIVILLNAVFLLQIAVISGIGLALGAAPPGGPSGAVVTGALVVSAAYLALLHLRPRFLTRRPTWRGLVDAGLAGHARAFLYRLPNMAVLIGCQILFMRCFAISVPVGVALLYLPAVMFVMGIPISVQGLGPTQLAQVALFARYVPGEEASAVATVLAWGIGSMLLTNVGTFLVGLACLGTRTGRRGLRAAREDRAEVSAAAPAAV